MQTKRLKIFYPNSKKVNHLIRHIHTGPVLAAAAKVLGIKEEELEPLERGFDALEQTNAEQLTMRLGDRRVRLEQVLQ